MAGELWPPLPAPSNAVLMNTFPRTRVCSGQGGHDNASYNLKNDAAL